jgi:putative ABC transport system permease protein
MRDVLVNRTRTILVVISIAIGVFAFGTILAGLIVVQNELRDAYLQTNPASGIITTSAFDTQLVDAVAHIPHVAQVQGRRAVAARIQLGPAQWQDTVLYVLPNDGVMDVNIVRPERGVWPAQRHTVLIERASLSKAQAHIGDTITIEVPGQQARQVRVAGTTHDLSLPPAVISGQVFAYVDADTMEWLGAPRS